MYLRFYYSPLGIEIFAVISDNGDIYWSGADVCKILNYTHPSNSLKRYLGSNLTKITNILENCYSHNYVLTYDQVIEFFNIIPQQRRVKIFEDWFRDVNNGSKKIYSLNPGLLQQYLFLHQKNNNLFKVSMTCSRNNCLRFDTTVDEEKNNSSSRNKYVTTTLPDILNKRRLVISSSSSNFGKRENDIEEENLMNDLLNCSNGENMEEEIEGRQKTNSTTTTSTNTTSFSELKEKRCDKSKNFIYQDECSGETYEYIAIDLNWKGNEMRPIHIYPALRFEEDGAFLYVPFKQTL